MRLALCCAAGTLALALAAPAQAHDRHEDLPPLPERGEARLPYPDQLDMDADDPARRAWLAECRRRQGADSGAGGAAIGAVVGGIAGNRLAGRGNRTVGTVVGAAAGAVAGAVIDKGEDRDRASDWCESYLDAYQVRQRLQQPWLGHPGYAWGAVTMVPMMMVPMAAAHGHQHTSHCRETVTYEYVEVPVRSRRIHRAAPPRKPVRIVPDKRIKL